MTKYKFNIKPVTVEARNAEEAEIKLAEELNYKIFDYISDIEEEESNK